MLEDWNHCCVGAVATVLNTRWQQKSGQKRVTEFLFTSRKKKKTHAEMVCEDSVH